MFFVPRARLSLLACLGLAALIGCRRPAPVQPTPEPPTLFVHYGNPQRWPGVLVILDDSALITLDTAAVVLQREAALWRWLDGRVVDSIRFLAPDSARRIYGSRAHRGAILMWTRAP
jgi:hypothetical protein